MPRPQDHKLRHHRQSHRVTAWLREGGVTHLAPFAASGLWEALHQGTGLGGTAARLLHLPTCGGEEQSRANGTTAWGNVWSRFWKRWLMSNRLSDTHIQAQKSHKFNVSHHTKHVDSFFLRDAFIQSNEEKLWVRKQCQTVSLEQLTLRMLHKGPNSDVISPPAIAFEPTTWVQIRNLLSYLPPPQITNARWRKTH